MPRYNRGYGDEGLISAIPIIPQPEINCQRDCLMGFRQLATGLLILLTTALTLLCPLPAWAQATKYYPPPPSYSHSIQTGKDFSGQNLRSAEFANSNLQRTNFSHVKAEGAIFSGSVMTEASLAGGDFTNAMLDLTDFTGAPLRDAVFVEAIFLGSTFDRVDITGADFTDALLDGAQVKQLCAIATGVNSKTGVKTRDSLLCP